MKLCVEYIWTRWISQTATKLNPSEKLFSADFSLNIVHCCVIKNEEFYKNSNKYLCIMVYGIYAYRHIHIP